MQKQFADFAWFLFSVSPLVNAMQWQGLSHWLTSGPRWQGLKSQVTVFWGSIQLTLVITCDPSRLFVPEYFHVDTFQDWENTDCGDIHLVHQLASELRMPLVSPELQLQLSLCKFSKAHCLERLEHSANQITPCLLQFSLLPLGLCTSGTLCESSCFSLSPCACLNISCACLDFVSHPTRIFPLNQCLPEFWITPGVPASIFSPTPGPASASHPLVSRGMLTVWSPPIQLHNNTQPVQLICTTSTLDYITIFNLFKLSAIEYSTRSVDLHN